MAKDTGYVTPSRASRRRGATMQRQGAPGLPTGGGFSIDRSVQAVLPFNTSATSAGTNPFTGRRSRLEARRFANSAIDLANAEVGARRAAGQRGLPSARQIRQEINRRFGL